MIETEEDFVITFEWEIDSLGTGLRGLKILDGFSVNLPREDHMCETGHWTVYLNGPEVFCSSPESGVRGSDLGSAGAYSLMVVRVRRRPGIRTGADSVGGIRKR